MESFTALHPLQSENSIQGALRLYYELAHALSEISGLAEFTLNPFAGAHGELTGLMLMRQYHIKRGDLKRTKVIVPDSAHGTNPASAAVCGLEIVEVPSTPEGTIDVTKLEPLLDDTIAGIMMTNPNTLGISRKRYPKLPNWYMVAEACSTTMERTSIPCWDVAVPATWVSTLCTSICIKPFPPLTEEAAPAVVP